MFRKKINLGLDVGESRVKFAAVESERGQLLDLWQEELFPERKARDQSLKGEELRFRLLELLKLHQKEFLIYGKAVKTSIQGVATFCRYLELPALSSKELEVAVSSRAVKYIPFPLESVNLSYVQVPPLKTGGKKSAVFFVAAQKEAVDELKRLLESCDLEIQRMEIPVLALSREFERNNPQLRDQFIALVQVGFKLTHLVLVRNGYPYYTREFSLAGRDFTYALQMGAQSGWKEADDYKLKGNYPLKIRKKIKEG